MWCHLRGVAHRRGDVNQETDSHKRWEIIIKINKSSPFLTARASALSWFVSPEPETRQDGPLPSPARGNISPLHTQSHTHTRSHSHTLTHAHTQSLTYSRMHTKSHIRSHTHTQSHAHTQAFTHAHTHTQNDIRIGPPVGYLLSHALDWAPNGLCMGPGSCTFSLQ